MGNPLTPEVLADPIALTRALVDIESVSGNEQEIADRIEEALRQCAHLSVQRHQNTIMARTDLGRDQRVVLAGHIDTVPLADNFPSRTEGEIMHGCGTSDMKSGTALALHLAATEPNPRHDVTYFFYECEEIDSARNGLTLVANAHPEWLEADFAVLLEPTYGLVEAGCQGTLRVLINTAGVRAHAARSWLGSNAIHAAADLLGRLASYEGRQVTIEGCDYREGLNVVRITGGVASNVIPDACEIEINFRYAPDRSPEQAIAHVREVCAGYDLTVVDVAPGALPGLSAPPAQEFLAAIGQPPAGKLGWTDVARFAELGTPAVNFGPGDPNLAHKRDERVELAKITAGAAVLRKWLAS